MSFIDDVKAKLDKDGLFNYETTRQNYVRLLDTPHIFGLPFNEEVMEHSILRTKEIERAVEDIIQKAVYRCDVASLHSPDPEWGKVILRAMDVCLSQRVGRKDSVQFRFLFGSTPYNLVFIADDLIDFKASLIRLIRERSAYWEVMPDIYLGIFSRIGAGIISALESKIFPPEILDSEDTKMTWNHSKVIATDGAEALIGGHNLNMDLFVNYPPVHDVSAVFHGQCVFGSQLYLNELWGCGSDLITKEKLDTGKGSWVDVTDLEIYDPLACGEPGFNNMPALWDALISIHQQSCEKNSLHQVNSEDEKDTSDDFREKLIDLPKPYASYDKLNQYRLAERILCLGKYWVGSNYKTDFKVGAEIMKETLIKSAKNIIRMSQQDIISAWKKDWAPHKVCIWLIEALLANPELEVQIVVSPLDAAAGAAGDQYSFGSGAQRTMDLIRYYMTHDVETDAVLDDSDGSRANALTRIKIAPFFFTDKVDVDHLLEGVNYKWPRAPKETYTPTLQQPPLSINPPSKGHIGSAVKAVINGSGYIYPKVAPAPGNHAKITIIDDELYLIGSDNMYPGYLSEIDLMVEGKAAVDELLASYWNPLWKYSSVYVVS